jgi:hypothetical protein
VRPVNPAAQGKIYPPVTLEVTPERVEAFRGVFGQAEGVPPTFATVAEFLAIPTLIGDPELGLDFTRVLHGGQEYEYARPLTVGETLTVTSRIGSIRIRGTSGFLVIVTELVDEEGAVVCAARSTMVEREP